MAVWDHVGTYSGRSAYRLRLRVQSYQVSGNSSTYQWWLYAEQTAAGTAWASDPTPWSVIIGGQSWSGSGNQDFRSTNSIQLGSGVAGWFGHDGNGYLNFSASASHTGSSPIGGASLSGNMSADRIPKVPGAPFSVALDTITPVSMRYQFSGTTDGGAAIDQWQIQYATDSGFSQNIGTLNSNGTSTLTGLTPGTRYWVRARGHNGVGWGSYGDAMNALTLSGGKIYRSGAWVQANPQARSAGAWKNPIVMIRDAGVWKPAK